MGLISFIENFEKKEQQYKKKINQNFDQANTRN